MIQIKDAIIIGKGPAGISAALYLKRAGLDIMIIGKGYGALEKTDKIENYYGLERTVTGKEVVDIGIDQAKKLGVEIITDEVTDISKEKAFMVKTSNGIFESLLVLLATGKSRTGVRIKGFEKLKGKGISFCAVCDGFFFKNKKLAVIGAGEYAVSEIEDLLRFTNDITLFTNGMNISAKKMPDGILVVEDKITAINGDTYVTGITTEKSEYDVDGIFVAIGTASAADFATKLGVMTSGDNIIVDENFMTNVDGLYAAGDAIGGYLQISKSVSDGALASRSMIKKAKTLK